MTVNDEIALKGVPAGISLRQAERKAAQKKAQAGRSEDDGAHLAARFLEAHRTCTEKISALLDDASSFAGNKQELKLAEAAASLAEAEQEAASSSYCLPAYDLRQVSARLKQLRDRLKGLKGQAQPKKEFSFSKRAAYPCARQPLQDVAQLLPRVQPPQTPAPGVEQAALPLSSASSPPCTQDPSRGIYGARHAVLVRQTDGLDFELSDLQDCSVHLHGRMGALRIRGLRRCLVYAGPVMGATFLEDVEDSCMVLVSRQVRAHTTVRTTLCMRVQSNPIIEHCNAVRFSALAAEDAVTATLISSEGVWEENGKWSKVQDFGWLKASQSPNWSIADRESCLRWLSECRQPSIS